VPQPEPRAFDGTAEASSQRPPTLPIDVEEYEVRATIDATFALAAGDDGREGRQVPSGGTAAP
jgi:hypothetical protein